MTRNGLPTTARRSLPARLALALAAPCVVLGALEIACRVAGVTPLRAQRPFGNFSLGWGFTQQPEPAVFRTHPTRFYEPEPSRRGIARTDAHGFRGPDHPPRHEHLVRIAVLGDSTTFGFGVTYGDGFVGRVASALRDRFPATDVDVIDAGCYGYSSYQNRVDLDERVLPLAPDIVVLCLPGFNDSIGALGFDDAGWGRRAPRDPGSFRAVLDHSRFAAALAKGLESVTGSARLADDAGDAIDLDEAQRRVLAGDVTQGRRVTVEAFADNVRAMIARARDAGATPILMRHPFRADSIAEDPYRAGYGAALERIARETNVAFADGAAHLDPADHSNYYDKIHPTELGHEKLETSLLHVLLDQSPLTQLATSRAAPAGERPRLELSTRPRDPGNPEHLAGEPFVVSQLAPASESTLSVTCRVANDDAGADARSHRYFVGGDPVDVIESRDTETLLALPPLPAGDFDLTVVTRSGSARIEGAIRVLAPRLEVTIDGDRARVVVTSGSLGRTFEVHVATAAADHPKPIMLRRTFGLADGATIGKPLRGALRGDPAEGPHAGNRGTLDIPLGDFAGRVPRLWVQAFVEPDPAATASSGSLGIVYPTNVVAIGG